MQGTRSFNGKRLIFFVIIPVLVLLALIGIDQITKYFADENKVYLKVIDNFFYLSYSTNKGAGFSLFADKEWGQLLFKIITPVALIAFFAFYFYAAKKGYKWLAYSLVLIISGTIGNFIDRLINGEVVDFLSFRFGNYVFPTFNVADICLTVGVIMLVLHFLVFDENAVFKKKQNPEIKTESGDVNNDENV